MLRALVLVAHKMIIRNWLKLHPPTIDQWTQRVKAVNCMENRALGHNHGAAAPSTSTTLKVLTSDVYKLHKVLCGALRTIFLFFDL